MSPAPLTSVDRTDERSVEQLRVFSWGSDSSGQYLFRYSHYERMFNFGGLTATGANVVTEPGVPTMDAASTGMYAFVVGDDNLLSVNFSSEWPFAWRDLGTPDGRTLNWLRPGVVFFPPFLPSQQRLFAFLSDSEGHLWAKVWHRSDDTTPQGGWVPLGLPPGTTVASSVDPVNFKFGGKDLLYAFLRGANGHLYVFRWDGGTDRLWADLGQPQSGDSNVPATPQAGNTRVSSAPGAVTYRFVAPTQTTDRMYAFVLGADNHLHVCYWNGVDLWLWTDLGGPTTFIEVSPASIAFGPIPVGGVRSRTLRITNHSEATPVTVSFPASLSGAFHWEAFNAVIAPGQQRNAVIEFSPLTEGSSHITLTITSNTPDSPHLIGITGRGIGLAP
jgi:hypothetical protein